MAQNAAAMAACNVHPRVDYLMLGVEGPLVLLGNLEFPIDKGPNVMAEEYLPITGPSSGWRGLGGNSVTPGLGV